MLDALPEARGPMAPFRPSEARADGAEEGDEEVLDPRQHQQGDRCHRAQRKERIEAQIVQNPESSLMKGGITLFRQAAGKAPLTCPPRLLLATRDS